MARIRSIKPDFWTDGNIVRLSPFARLLYIGMWNFAQCDHGHVADDALKLKLQIFPMDDLDIDALLLELIDSDRVERLSAPDGRTYLHVKRFEDHQKIDPRWKSRCPACTQADSLTLNETRVSLTEPHRDSPELTLGKERIGRDRRGKEEETCSPAPPSSEYPEAFEEFWNAYPRKAGKRKALAVWQRAVKRDSREAILAGALRYAQDPNRSEQYTKYAEGWLNGDGWLDEPLPSRGTVPDSGLSRADAKVQGYLDIGARLTSQPKEIA